MDCLQNKIIKSRTKGNPVSLEFYFDGEFRALGLNNFTRIEVSIGDEVYDTDGGEVEIYSPTELRFRIGAVTGLLPGDYTIIVTGYSATYTNGYELTSEDVCPIASVTVV